MRLQGGLGITLVIEERLPLTHHSEAVIIDEGNFNGEII